MRGTRVRERRRANERRKGGQGVCVCGGGLLQGGAEERASWQRVRAQTEFLMGDDPLFTDLSEAIVYDRPGLLSCPSRQTVLRGLIDAALPPVNAKSRERDKRKKRKGRRKERNGRRRPRRVDNSARYRTERARLGIRPSNVSRPLCAPFAPGSLRPCYTVCIHSFPSTLELDLSNSLVCQRGRQRGVRFVRGWPPPT